MPKEALQITKELTIQLMKKDHRLNEATAKKLYDEVLNELKQEYF